MTGRLLQGGLNGVLRCGVALAVVALPMLAAALLSGCGAAALHAQVDGVQVAGIVWEEADQTIVRSRARHLDSIVGEANEVCANGCTDQERDVFRARLRAAEERWAPAMACRAPVPEALRTWLDGIDTARRIESDEVRLRWLVALASRVALEYEALRACIERAAPEVDLPELPPEVVTYARGAAL